jgi:lysophospholipase L1-like esterase
MLRSRLRWAIAVVALLSILLGAVVAVPALHAFATQGTDGEKDYLALGDSVAFGTNPLFDAHNAANFTGYPTPVAAALDENLTNAACPGEASGGFISLTGVDNVCRPYRAHFPLHVAYSTDQLDFALQFLDAHPHTRLVTINIGANDLFVLQRQCAGSVACIQAGLPTMLAALGANLDTIYGAIRNTAHYHHQLVALTYYSLDYRDPVGVGIISEVNQVVADRTQAWDGAVADGFGAFAANSNNGDTCVAGLRIPLPAGGCDIHPSPAGRDLLAAAILAVVHQDDGNGDG